MNRRDLVKSDLLRTIVLLLALALILLALRSDLLGEKGDRILHNIRDSGPNEVAVDLMVQNYYEQVLDFDRAAFDNVGPLRDILRDVQDQPEGRGRYDDVETVRDLEEGFLFYEFVPNAARMHKGVMVRINRWGMRDKDREKSKPPGTFRIVLVGASNGAAMGIEMEEGFAWLLEERLNRELVGAPGIPYEAYEVVNYSVNGYHLLERLYMLDQRVAEFEPDLVLCTTYYRDIRRAVAERLARRVIDRRDLHFEFLERIVAKAGVSPGDTESRVEQRLTRHRREIVHECFREMGRISQRIGVPITLVVLRLDAGPINRDLQWMADAAERIIPTVRVFDSYEGRPASEVYLDMMDRHPTAFAHALIADELYQDLLAHPVTGPMLRGQTAAGSPNTGSPGEQADDESDSGEDRRSDCRRKGDEAPIPVVVNAAPDTH